MTRASKAEVRRHGREVRDTLAHIERALRDDNFDQAVNFAAHAFEQARALEYAARALARAKAGRAAAAERREHRAVSRSGAS